MCIKLIVSRFFRRKKRHAEEPREKFVSRLSATQVRAAVQHVLGRRLLASERTAFDVGWRPQGLLDADDSYVFRVSSPMYRGRAVPIVYIDALALDGYGRDDERPLTLIERAIVTLENPGVDSPFEVVD